MVNKSDGLEYRELREATAWIFSLKEGEQERVLSALDIVHNLEFRVDGQKVSLTVIGAGSSIQRPGDRTDQGRKYNDIDLFLLLNERPSEVGLGRYDTVDTKMALNDSFRHGQFEPPAHVYYMERYDIGRHKFICDLGERKYFSEENILELSKQMGAPVIISLFQGSDDFNARRPGKPDDILNLLRRVVFPPSKEFIEYNRQMKSRFLVLNRQQ